MNSWDRIRNYLQEKVSAESYDNWLKGAVYVRTEGATLFVSVPDRETRTWLEKEYAAFGSKRASGTRAARGACLL